MGVYTWARPREDIEVGRGGKLLFICVLQWHMVAFNHVVFERRIGKWSFSSLFMLFCYSSFLAASCPMAFLDSTPPPQPALSFWREGAFLNLSPYTRIHLFCVLLYQCLAGREGSSSDVLIGMIADAEIINSPQ